MRGKTKNTPQTKPRRRKSDSTDDSGAIRLPVFASMQAVHAATGIPLAVQKNAKRAGCAAFSPNGRVELEPLLRFLFAPGGGTKTPPGAAGEIDKMEWGERHKRAQALFVEQKLAERQGVSVPLDVVEDRDSRVAVAARMLLERRLRDEIPPRIADRPVAAVREAMESVIDDVCAAMAEGLTTSALMAGVRAAQDAEEEPDEPEAP